MAQQATYENQLVQLANGEEAWLWISFDEATELLHYKRDKKGTPATYQPIDVVSFRYGGSQYYSLPLRDGYFTFFRIFHEGKEFAVMEKSPNFKTLRIISDESGGKISMCQDKRKNGFYLCFYDHSYGSNISSVREFEVKKLVYLAIEGKIKLFYMETDERFFIFDNWMGPRPGKRRIENMLEDFIENPQKRKAIQEKVKQEKLDIRYPQHLIVALEAVYH